MTVGVRQEETWCQFVGVPPYDNKEYRFRDSDPSAQAGRERVALLLGLPNAPNEDGLRFDLSFYSGGIGVYDQHAIAMNADAGLWSATKKHLSAKTPTESAGDDSWSEEFNWLVYGDDEFPSLNDAVVMFINRQRKDFQDQCTPNMTVLFQASSNVNDWSALWGTNTRLNYLGFSQG